MSETATAQPKVGLIDRVGLRWFFRLLSSSIGQKFVMGLTGLLLCSFLVVHLAGNLFLYAGAEPFNDYSHMMEHLEWLPLAEAGLFVLFLVHLYLAVVTSTGNTAARVDQYAMQQSKQPRGVLQSRSSAWMFGSGAVVLGFVLLHLIDLRMGLRPDVKYLAHDDPTAPYANTVAILSNPISRVVYSLGAIVLGFHLSHGFASAFQSLGLNHPKYTPLIKWAGRLFAIAIAVGFASLPIIIPSLKR